MERLEDGAPAHRHRSRHGQLQHQPDDVPRGDLRPGREPAGGVRPDAELLQPDGGAGQRHFEPEQRRARRDCRCCFRTRRCSTRTTTRTASSPRPACRSSTALGSCGRRISRGATGSSPRPTTRARRRTSTFPGFLNINTTQDVVDQPDQGHGQPHVQDRLLQQPQPEAGEQRPGCGRQLRHAELRQRHGRHQSLRHVVRVRQRGDRQLQLVRAGLEIRRGHASSTTTSRATCRTTGR